MSYECFISYVSEDIKFAEELHARLIAENFTVWFDKARLDPGCDWHKEIEAGCEQSRIVIPVLTPRWKMKEWTKYETYGAEAVIPLVFKGKLEDVLTPPLIRFQGDAVNLAGNDNPELWPKLFDSIRKLLATPPPETKEQRISHLRFTHNPNFVGREALLDDIHEKLFTYPTTALTQGHIQAVTALGGVGKTTVAHEYAEKFWRCYRQIFWLSCKAGLLTEMASIYPLLFPERPEAGLKDAEKADMVLRELKRPDAIRRLIVFDDAIDEDSVLDWLPKTGNCHTIITTRFTDWQTGIEQTPVWVLDQEPARKLLLRRAGVDEEMLGEDEIAACNELAGKLGFLPLALEQAAAYIWNQNRGQVKGFGFRKYLEFYAKAENERRLLEKKSSKGSTEYPDAVFNTWRTTIEQLPAGARAILRLASFMAPTPIPFRMFLKGACKVAEQAEMFDALSLEPDEFELREWKEALTRYSMIKLEEGDAFSIHMLVQAVERQNIVDEERNSSFRLSADIVVSYGPQPAFEPSTWDIWNVLIPHAEMLHGLYDKYLIVERNVSLLKRLDEYNFGRAKFSESAKYSKERLEINERQHGPDSLVVATDLLNYGESLRELRKYNEAKKCFERCLLIREKKLGAQHKDLAASLNYLGLVHNDLGNSMNAELLYKRGLKICNENDDCQSDIQIKLNINLAAILFLNKDYDGAEPLYKRALMLCENFHDNSIYTAQCLSMLALLLQAKGDLAGAEPYFRRSLDMRKQAYGLTHPATANGYVNLARLLLDLGKHIDAEENANQAINIWKKSYTPNDPRLGKAYWTIGMIEAHRGNRAIAIGHLEEALQLLCQGHGNEHPWAHEIKAELEKLVLH